MQFREWKLLIFKWNFMEMCYLWSNWQYVSIAWGNGLAPNRRYISQWWPFSLRHISVTSPQWVTRKSRSIQICCLSYTISVCMMTPSNGNIFRVTGPLCGEFMGHWWIPLTKASDAELWCFLRSAPWINGWVNSREAGDWRHHRAHYDVSVMCLWL